MLPGTVHDSGSAAKIQVSESIFPLKMSFSSGDWEHNYVLSIILLH